MMAEFSGRLEVAVQLGSLNLFREQGDF